VVSWSQCLTVVVLKIEWECDRCAVIVLVRNGGGSGVKIELYINSEVKFSVRPKSPWVKDCTEPISRVLQKVV
jgi:hypothetical protein